MSHSVRVHPNRFIDGEPCFCISTEEPHEGWIHGEYCLFVRQRLCIGGAPGDRFDESIDAQWTAVEAALPDGFLLSLSRAGWGGYMASAIGDMKHDLETITGYDASFPAAALRSLGPERYAALPVAVLSPPPGRLGQCSQAARAPVVGSGGTHRGGSEMVGTDYSWRADQPADRPPRTYSGTLKNPGGERQWVWLCDDCGGVFPKHFDVCRVGKSFDDWVEQEGFFRVEKDHVDAVPYCSDCGGALSTDGDSFEHTNDVGADRYATARECWVSRFGEQVR